MDLLTLYWLSVGVTLLTFIILFIKESFDRGLDKTNTLWALGVVVVSFIPLLNVSLIFNYLYSFYEEYKELKEDEASLN